MQSHDRFAFQSKINAARPSGGRQARKNLLREAAETTAEAAERPSVWIDDDAEPRQGGVDLGQECLGVPGSESRPILVEFVVGVGCHVAKAAKAAHGANQGRVVQDGWTRANVSRRNPLHQGRMPLGAGGQGFSEKGQEAFMAASNEVYPDSIACMNAAVWK